jgi:hypothetical protein
MSIPQKMAKATQADGIVVLRQVGELMEIAADYVKAY